MNKLIDNVANIKVNVLSVAHSTRLSLKKMVLVNDVLLYTVLL